MTLAGIELVYLVNDIGEKTSGYYASNIWGINRNSLLFKLHHPTKPDIMLMVSSIGMWITDKKIDSIEPNKMLRRLRSDLLRSKLTKIEQIGTPSEIYSSPNSSFVANFVGTSNIFDKSIAKEVFNIDSAFSIRPEKISLLINEADNQYSIDGKIIEKQFHGSFVKLIIETTFSKQLIVNLNQSNPNLSLGNEIKLGWSKEDIITLDK